MGHPDDEADRSILPVPYAVQRLGALAHQWEEEAERTRRSVLRGDAGGERLTELARHRALLECAEQLRSELRRLRGYF